VSWNAPFKSRIKQMAEIWMMNDANKEYTAAGNPRAPPLEIVLDWVYRAWNELPKETIKHSFETCGLTTPFDGSGDCKIHVFKPNGAIGPKGLDAIKQARTVKTVKDGRLGSEGLFDPEENDLNLETVDDDDPLIFTDVEEDNELL
jgi:hypothetical protein